MAKFRLPNSERIRIRQKFDPEKIFVIKAGQKINVYDAIQEASIDTDIYKTLEKYGSLDPLNKPNLQELQEEFTEFETLMSLQDKLKKADEMWNKLDAGVREQFQNDKMKFINNGKKWVESLKPKPKQEPKQEPKKDTEVTKNV